MKIAVVLIVLSLASGLGHAAVYKCIEASGSVTYSDRACPERVAQAPGRATDGEAAAIYSKARRMGNAQDKDQGEQIKRPHAVAGP